MGRKKFLQDSKPPYQCGTLIVLEVRLEKAKKMSFEFAILILRLVVGLTVAVHGAQKLLDWFEGAGSLSLSWVRA